MSPPKSSRRRSGKTLNKSYGKSNGFPSLFSEEEELKLMNCYFEIKKSTHNSQPIIHPSTLDRLEKILGFKYSRTQIVDKLRRLRIKYHKFARTKSLIKTLHDRQIYEIGRKIWGKGPSSSRKNSKGKSVTSQKENPESKTPSEVPILRKNKVSLEKFPVLVNEFSKYWPGNVVWIEGLKSMEERNLMGMNEKWMLLHIEEAELKARKAVLVQKQAKAVLEAAVVSNGIR